MAKEKVSKRLEEIKELFIDFEQDTQKFIDNDNKSASTRARVAASNLTKKLKEIRQDILNARKK